MKSLRTVNSKHNFPFATLAQPHFKAEKTKHSQKIQDKSAPNDLIFYKRINIDIKNVLSIVVWNLGLQ